MNLERFEIYQGTDGKFYRKECNGSINDKQYKNRLSDESIEDEVNGGEQDYLALRDFLWFGREK